MCARNSTVPETARSQRAMVRGLAVAVAANQSVTTTRVPTWTRS